MPGIHDRGGEPVVHGLHRHAPSVQVLLPGGRGSTSIYRIGTGQIWVWRLPVLCGWLCGRDDEGMKAPNCTVGGGGRGHLGSFIAGLSIVLTALYLVTVVRSIARSSGIGSPLTVLVGWTCRGRRWMMVCH